MPKNATLACEWSGENVGEGGRGSLILAPKEVKEILRKYSDWLTWSSWFWVLTSPFCGKEECAAKAWEQAKGYRVSEASFERFEDQTERYTCDYCGKQTEEGFGEVTLTPDGRPGNTNFILEVSKCCGQSDCAKQAWEKARDLVVVDVEMVD